MRIMAKRMTERSAKDFALFLQTNEELVNDAQGVLASHYSRERLESEAAKTGWMEPDREPIR
jgi:hypothetical protein